MQQTIIYAVLLALSDAFMSPQISPLPLKKYQRNQIYAKGSFIEEAATLKAQAERMRLEAERMDTALTLSKISNIEKKLNDSSWRGKHPDESVVLLQTLEALQNKLTRPAPSGYTDKSFVAEKKTSAPTVNTEKDFIPAVSQSSILERPAVASMNETQRRLKAFPIAGFDQNDLEKYLPVAYEIESVMANATIEEKLLAFRERPDLQEHFQAKIQALLVKPLEDMAKLEDLKKKYFTSRSKKEKESIKRELERLEESYESNGPLTFLDNIDRGTPPMSEEEMALRLKTMSELPPLMQDVFKRRNGLETDGSLRLAIELEHYEQQLQLMDQIRYLSPLNDAERQDSIKGFDAMPESIRKYFCTTLGIAENSTATDVVAKLESGSVFGLLGRSNRVLTDTARPDLPEYNDLDFIDRSRYASEFVPAFTRMENCRPSLEQINAFQEEVLSKKTFTLRSKPERVLGGYYLRGQNQFSSKKGEATAGDKLVSALNENLRKSSLEGKIQFFYVTDPSPPTDEELEMGGDSEPILLVTSVKPDQFYKLTHPRNKIFVSSAGLISTFVTALGACELNGLNYQQFNAQINAYNAGTGDLDITWLTNMAAPIVISLIGIQIVHEFSHRLVAWRDKFDISLPTLIPSIQLGLTGAITQFKSPPPNLKSLFDFSFVGPLSGMAISLVLMVYGLGETIHLDLSQQAALPALPIGFFRASALGGGIVEMFLGNGVLDAPDTSVLPISPLAIAGFLGLISNALAFLPLGHTDGGRITLAMFGRRGAFLIKSFTTLTLCAVGLFGLDSERILVLYVLFVTVWQRELESPMQNEVDELDFGRACVGIASSLLVTLTLLPHT